MEIKSWLEGLALAEYEPAFHDHQITGDVLGDLSDDDLKSIGIAPLGARKRLLKAIAALRARADLPKAEHPAARTAHQPAERRHLTVMFVDMVGSTPLSTALDPEDLGTVIGRFHAAVCAQVAAFGGFTACSFGDGLLAYFGYPQAHEDDAARAVRAALASIEALRGVTGPGVERVEARIGIATGWVVLGDLAGTAQHEVAGETANLAARLLSLAPPGGIVLSKPTAPLLGDAFDLADLGRRPLKGFGDDQGAYLVISARISAGFDAKAERGLTPLVGREADLGILLDRWSRVQDGEGQVVVLTGEPGIGKSRSVHSLQERLEQMRHKAMRWQCSPFHVSSALHPVIGQLEAAAGITRDEDGVARLAGLRRLHPGEADGEAGTFAQLLAELLSVPGVAPPDLPPEEKKARLFVGLTDWLSRLAAGSPVLLVVEDAHWIDPTTAELLDRIVEAVLGLPVMVLVTARPEYQPPAAWTRLDRFSHHHLNRLGRRQVAELAERVAGAILPRELLDHIIAKTDGVPLFVEELTKAVLESDAVEKPALEFVLSGPLLALAVPATLQNSLTARLDRLSSAKPVAQIGAALGREFTHALIEALAEIDGPALATALGRLQSAGLVFHSGSGPERVYTFKHALIRDAAYDSLLKSQRAALHRRIAATLEASFATLAEAEPELVARHWTEAGSPEVAVHWWRKAGRRALSRLAFQEAISQFEQALALAPGLLPGADRDRLVAGLWLDCAAALRQTQWGSRRMEDAARSALSIGISLDDQTIVGHALTALAEVAAVRPDFALFRETNRDFLRLELCLSEGLHTRFMLQDGPEARPPDAGSDGSVLQLLSAVERIAIDDDVGLIGLAEAALARSRRRGKFYSARASTIWQFIGLEMFWCGRFSGIDRILERAIESAEGNDPSYVGWRQDLLAKTWLAFSSAQLGAFDRGRALARHCVDEADRVAELSHLVLALNAHNVFCFYCDDAGPVQDPARRLEEVSFRYGIAWYQPAALLTRAWATARSGGDGARDAWTRGRAMLDSGLFAQIHVGVPHLLALSAHTANALGSPGDALADIDRGLDLVAKTGEAHSQSELYRARGEILGGLGERAAAERGFRQALEVADRQSARGLELRAATSLGRLLRAERRPREARKILEPLYARFTEGSSTPIMRQARAVLDEL